MIVDAPAGMDGLDDLAFSLKPPKVLRNLVKSAASAIGIKATVPTPAGPIIVDTRDPDTLKRAADAARELLTRTTVTVGQREQPVSTNPANFVESSIPGGWLTLGLLGIGGFILVKKATS
jgi:hypothetical protein